MIVALVILLFVIYNNITAFSAGYDDCRWGEPTQTQCGFGLAGTARGKVFGIVLYGPGFLLGKALAPDQN